MMDGGMGMFDLKQRKKLLPALTLLALLVLSLLLSWGRGGV